MDETIMTIVMTASYCVLLFAIVTIAAKLRAANAQIKGLTTENDKLRKRLHEIDRMEYKRECQRSFKRGLDAAKIDATESKGDAVDEEGNAEETD